MRHGLTLLGDLPFGAVVPGNRLKARALGDAIERFHRRRGLPPVRAVKPGSPAAIAFAKELGIAYADKLPEEAAAGPLPVGDRHGGKPRPATDRQDGISEDRPVAAHLGQYGSEPVLGAINDEDFLRRASQATGVEIPRDKDVKDTAGVLYNWLPWSEELQKSGLGRDSHFAMMNIFAWEGGLKADKKNGVIRAVAGIPNDKYLEKYLKDAGIPSGTRSQDLTNEQRIAVYRSNFGWESGAFGKVGGINSLEKMGDPRIAAAIADSFVRRGAPIIEPVLQLSINATLEAYPALSSSLTEARRPANGPDRPSHSAAKIAEDGIVGPDMMRALQVIATSEAAIKLLLNQIADRRLKYDTDKYGALKEDDYDLRRYNYFRFQ